MKKKFPKEHSELLKKLNQISQMIFFGQDVLDVFYSQKIG